jgi:hypothetical protein
VPYLEGYETIEHFSHLGEWSIKQDDRGFFVENRRVGASSTERYDNLLFHGGPGQVLEMRVYGEGDLLARLAYVGFRDVQTIEPNRADIGVVWGPTIEHAFWRGRGGKGYVMVCR